jgi:hypothetical protein
MTRWRLSSLSGTAAWERELHRQQLRRFRLRLELVVGEVRDTGVGAQGLQQRRVGEVAEGDERLSELLPGGPLHGKRFVELLSRDQPRLDERVSQPTPYSHGLIMPVVGAKWCGKEGRRERLSGPGL